MTRPAETRLRVGVDGVRARAVAVDGEGRLVAVHRGRRGDSPARVLDALFRRGAGTASTDRVVAILPDLTLAGSARRARVGVLRIGAPAATAVPPLAGWTTERASLAGPVAMVGGGHEYDGRVAAPLDVPAVAAFARTCAGKVDAIALTGVNALENPEHEQLAAAVIAEELGPDVPVVRGAETEALGLLERENTAVLDAALARAARAHIDELSASVRGHAPGAALYLVRGDGTVLPALDGYRHATAWRGAALGGLLHGAARLAGVPSAIVVEVTADRAVVGTTIDGLLPDSGLPREIDGVRTGLRAPRLTVIQRRDAAFTGRLHAALARAGGGPDELPVVLVGEAPDDLPALPGIAPIRPEDGDLAAAFGAAAAEAAGSVDRIFWQGTGGGQDSVTRARMLALDAALRAGADPRKLRETPVREALMTYVPVPAARLQVTAVGPLLELADVAAVEP
ncbi:hydantoinase/oxoprolinase N-terminal domain-containing protein [Prauserella flavalba]|uniref:Hydantoinase/oxoprolinase n=1 Tax=Prauserella flavalba TaxID=1477506 RepID=A0A318LGP9_9PSEU|nr:hydantoinase/oxoprolinase N-terminal domain-containing protein [Prauserella flavalba]PXY18764.1 hydantoinase/oxoprolinase [Prauserella flavalba]